MKKRGFTFIEMLIYMGLVASFFMVLAGVIGAILDSQLESQASSAVDQDAQYLLARLDYDIHRATTITTPASLGETTSSLGLTINGITHTYSLSGQKLLLTVSGESNVLNSFDCLTSGFSVTRIGYVSGTPSVRIALDLQSVTVSLTQNPQTRSFTTTLSLR